MGKKLYLIRHGESGWATGELDFERSLTLAGEKDARDAGSWLQRRLVEGTPIYCSPATRTRLTLKQLGLGEATKFESSIYEARAGRLLDLVQSVDELCFEFALIGHNPGISELAQILLGTGFLNLPPAGVVVIDLCVERWTAVGSVVGVLAGMWVPMRFERHRK